MRIIRFNENLDTDWSSEFDDFVNVIYDFFDKYDFINIKFTTADGSVKSLRMEDYKVGDSYDRFITALGGMTVHFNVIVDIKKNDFDVFVDIMNVLRNDRIKNIGWSLKEIKSYYFPVVKYQRGHYIIDAEFIWDDESVHGKKNTYHLTGE
jgi:hypothetical protein